MGNGIIDFTLSSESLIKEALEFKREKNDGKAFELLETAIENADSPEAYVEYAKMLSLYGWAFAGSLLARGSLIFPDSELIKTHLLFIVVVLRDPEAYKIYSGYVRGTPPDLSKVDALIPEYVEAIRLDLEEGEEDDDDDDESDEPEPVYPALRLTDDFDDWLIEQDEEIRNIGKRGLKNYSPDALEKYIDGKIRLGSVFTEYEKITLGENFFSIVRTEKEITPQEDAIALKMLYVDKAWEKPLFIKGKLSERKSPEDKALARKLLDALSKEGEGESARDGAFADREEFTLYYAMRQELYEEICAYFRKFFEPSEIWTEELEYCYGYSSLMTGRYSAAEKSFENLKALDPFSLSTHADLIYTRLIKEDPEKWACLKDFVCSNVTAPKETSTKVFRKVAETVDEKDALKLAAVMLKNENKSFPSRARAIRQCRLMASDLWIDKTDALKKELRATEKGTVLYANEHMAYRIVINRQPKLRKIFEDYICSSVKAYLPLDEEVLAQAADILDDMYERLKFVDISPEKLTPRRYTLAQMTLLWRLGLPEGEVFRILDRIGITRKSFINFRESLYE